MLCPTRDVLAGCPSGRLRAPNRGSLWDIAALIAILILALTPVTSALATPPHRHSAHRKRYKHNDAAELPRMWIHSKLTAFAPEKPAHSPWSDMPERGERVRPSVLALLVNSTNLSLKARSRRTAPEDDGDESPWRPRVKQSVCDSVSDWVQKAEAENMWGVRVNLSQSINVGGRVLNQYFFETFCRHDDGRPCRGIDSSSYSSVCENKYIWAYARVETYSTADEWTLIKVRGSCSCALSRRPLLEAPSVWDDLRRR